MQVINIFLIVSVLTIYSYVVGRYITEKLNVNLPAICCGFLLSISVFQIISLPFMFLKSSFSVLFITISIVFVFLFIISVMQLNKNNINENAINYISNELKNNYIYIIIIAFVLVFQIFMVILLIHEDADDSFYIAEISTILESNKILAFEPSTGLEFLSIEGIYKLVGYEVFLAYLCKLFHINAAFFSHTIFPIFILFVEYQLCYFLSQKFSEKNKWQIFILIRLIGLFGGYSVYTKEMFLAVRSWQGKASFVNICLPFLLLCFWEIFEKELTSQNIIGLCLLFYSAFAFTTVALYLFPIAYGLFWLVDIIANKNIKKSLRLIIPLVTAMPYVLIKFYCLTQEGLVNKYNDQNGTVDWINWVRVINGHGYMLALVLLSFVLLLFIGSRRSRYLFCLYDFLLLLTFLNPMLADFVAKHITGIDVYWRLFWILQWSYIAVAAFSELMNKGKKKLWFAIAMVCIVIVGKPIYTKENFAYAANWEKISEEGKTIVDEILHRQPKARCMMPIEYSYEVRQYSGNIVLLWSRYSADRYIEQGYDDYYNELSYLNNKIYINRIVDKADFDLARKYGCEFLTVYMDSEVENPDYSVIYEDNIIRIYDLR